MMESSPEMMRGLSNSSSRLPQRFSRSSDRRPRVLRFNGGQQFQAGRNQSSRLTSRLRNLQLFMRSYMDTTSEPLMGSLRYQTGGGGGTGGDGRS